MKRKLIEAFERPEYSKFGRFEAPSVQSHVTQPQATPTNQEPTPADIDLHNVMTNFVNIYEKLDPTDDPALKPNYSYTELVYLAVLRSPNFCLPIGEIYKYVQNRFAFFRNNARQHWKNAIRHSLSKTKCFTKISLGRGSGGSSRSCFLWSIDPCSIINFARGDYRPNVDRDSGTNTLRWGYYHTNAGNFWDQVTIVLETKIEFFKACLLVCPSPSKLCDQQICNLPEPNVQNQLPQCSTPMTPVHQQPQTVSHPTPSQSSTPPPNVVCQPNGAFYSSSTPVVYNSSTPVYSHFKPALDHTPVPVHHAQVPSDASPVSHYGKVSCDQEIFYESSINSHQAASPGLNGSCAPSPESTCVTPRWSPVYCSNDSSIGKDSGIELSSADLESIRDAIIQQYHSSPVESRVFEACGSQVDLNTSSYQSNDSGHEESEELPVFPAYVADDQPLDLSVIPHMTTTSNATNVASYQPYNFSHIPQYNFSRVESNHVYSFDASKSDISAYQPVQWFQ